MIAYLDIRKGVKPVAHTRPDECPDAHALVNPMRVSRSTAALGTVIGQWAACPTCQEITAKEHQLVHEV